MCCWSWEKCQRTFVVLVTSLMPVTTYFILLSKVDPVVGNQNAKHSAVSCFVLFAIVALVTVLTYTFIRCLVKDESLKKLQINLFFALFFTVSFHLIVMHLRNKPSITQYFFNFNMPNETYLFALYIVLSRGRTFLQTLVIVNNDRLFEQWEEERNKRLKHFSWNFCHTLLYFLPAVEFFLEVVFFPGLKHSTVVWLGSSNNHKSAFIQLFTYICVDHVEVEGGFTMLGVPIYVTCALLYLVLFTALCTKTVSNWFIVLTILEGALVLSVQILLLNPISFFVTFSAWFYIKPYKKIISKDDALTLEELMLKGSNTKESVSTSDKKSIVSLSFSSLPTSSSDYQNPKGGFRYFPFDEQNNI